MEEKVIESEETREENQENGEIESKVEDDIEEAKIEKHRFTWKMKEDET